MLRVRAVTPSPTLQTPGAGRTIDLHWPRDLGNAASFIARGGVDSLVQVLTALDGTAVINLVSVNGMAVTRFASGNGGAVAYMSANRITFFTERPVGPLRSSRSCWDIGMIARFDAPTGVIAGDAGVMVNAGASQAINGTGALTQPGIMFGPTAPGVVSVRARRMNAGPLTLNQAIAAPNVPDVTQFHDWCIRIVTGDAEADPYAVCMIDGVEVSARFAWTAAAAILPPPDGFAANNVGYRPSWAARGNGLIANWDVVETYVRAAETVEGLA